MTMILPAPAPVRRRPWGVALSVAAHLAAGLIIVLLSVARPLDQAVQPPQAISVELLAAPPPKLPPAIPELSVPAPAAPAAPAAPSAAAPSGRVPAPTATAPQSAPAAGMTEATKLYATSFLKSPANAKLKKTLASFADSEKIVQLCNMEGTEQIRLANPKYNPDVLVSYAMADFAIDGLTLIADGGAFHSNRSWTAIRLRCTVSPDYLGVTRFAFAIGKPIPRSQWNSYNLPEQYQESE